MKGKINSDGVLEICRSKEFTEQSCIRFNDNELACGDECPAFREPVKGEGFTTKITLCRDIGDLIFTEFSDERS